MRPSVTAAAAVVLVTALLITASEAGFLRTKVHLAMINRLDSKAMLQVHCYKDGHHDPSGDLGVHCLHPEEYYETVFRPNFWGTTHYSCSYAWNGVMKWFYIYINARDLNRCVPDCWWYIKEKGPCMMHPKDQKEDACFDWNKDI